MMTNFKSNSLTFQESLLTPFETSTDNISSKISAITDISIKQDSFMGHKTSHIAPNLNIYHFISLNIKIIQSKKDKNTRRIRLHHPLILKRQFQKPLNVCCCQVFIQRTHSVSKEQYRMLLLSKV